jgi:anaerobic magnesium-protoporphyrin IX monomethyl ester cyclase
MRDPIKVLMATAAKPYEKLGNPYNPLWPAYLGAYIERNIGKNQYDFKYCEKSFAREMLQYRPDIIALSSISQSYSSAKYYADLANRCNIPVIIGGLHITALPETITPEMKIGCLGEGEETFLELMIHFLEHNKFVPASLRQIKGIIYWDGPQLIRTPDRPPLPSLDLMPRPKRDITGYHYRDYVYTARGCRSKCVFCSCSQYWGKIRYSRPDQVVDELLELIENGVKVIRFANESFADNIDYLKQLADLIVAHDIQNKARFSCWLRANTVSNEVVDLLKLINIVSVKLGFESGNQRTLTYLKGNVSVEENLRAIGLLKAAGLQVNGDFIIGSPDESTEEMMDTYRFIKRAPLNFMDVNILTPYPGTPLWEYAMRKKIVSENMDWGRINIKLNETRKKSLLLSEKLTLIELNRVFRRFQRLIHYKAAIALLRTPWRNEIPGIIFIRFRKYFSSRIYQLVGRAREERIAKTICHKWAKGSSKY